MWNVSLIIHRLLFSQLRSWESYWIEKRKKKVKEWQLPPPEAQQSHGYRHLKFQGWISEAPRVPGMNTHICVYIPMYKFSAKTAHSFHQILKGFPDLQMFADA